MLHFFAATACWSSPGWVQAALPADAPAPAAGQPEDVPEATDDEEDDDRLRAALVALSADSPAAGAHHDEVGVLGTWLCCEG